MKIIDSEQLICVDVDNCLCLWNEQVTPENQNDLAEFYDPYDKQTKWVLIHRPHIKIVRDRYARGATIIIWSQSGYEWAVQAAKTCGLNDLSRLYIASKPVAIIDDLPASDWMSERIFLPANSKYGIGQLSPHITPYEPA